jgi:hypothetical protein
VPKIGFRLAEIEIIPPQMHELERVGLMPGSPGFGEDDLVSTIPHPTHDTGR